MYAFQCPDKYINGKDSDLVILGSPFENFHLALLFALLCQEYNLEIPHRAWV